MSLNAGDRGTQLVGHVGDQFAALLVCLICTGPRSAVNPSRTNTRGTGRLLRPAKGISATKGKGCVWNRKASPIAMTMAREPKNRRNDSPRMDRTIPKLRGPKKALTRK